MQPRVFTVEPASGHGEQWCIKHDGRIRARYGSRAQAIVDARQLAAFENELRGRTALVRAYDSRRETFEEIVCEAAHVSRTSERRAHRRESVSAT
jgi:hypothetical protein